jgi:glycine oxidase
VAPDVVIVGAGLIGLAIALELHDRGASVTVIDHGRSLAEASTAAAGMLAVEDPYNPPELEALSRLSAQLYPAFLRRIEALCGIAVPFQTNTTVQYMADGSTMRLAEHSIDPRQLAAALLSAVKATPIRLLEQTRIAAVDDTLHGMQVRLSTGAAIASRAVIYAAGAWTSEVMTALHSDTVSIAPRKGQMLRVRLPAALALNEVHRSERIYIVPRTRGPQTGTALIGATVENAGFDTTVRAEDLDGLRALAAELLPAFASAIEAPLVESWAGLRPATPDGLPVLGACARAGHFIASGHYRNGILQAPATAVVLADLLEGRPPSVDITALSPERFARL